MYIYVNVDVYVYANVHVYVQWGSKVRVQPKIITFINIRGGSRVKRAILEHQTIK